METENKELEVKTPETPSALDKIIDKQLERFNADTIKHLSEGLDSTIILLKGHLLIEYYLGMLLILSDEEEKVLEASFYEKLTKCKEKNLLGDKKYLNSLLKLNKLRNRMAHELEYVISESDIDSIAMPFGKSYVVKKLGCEAKDRTKELLLWTLKRSLTNIVVKTIVKLHAEKKTLDED